MRALRSAEGLGVHSRQVASGAKRVRCSPCNSVSTGRRTARASRRVADRGRANCRRWASREWGES
ncbi:hypothetical protein F7D14_10695 [Methylocystis parvus]|uniref:Uncharacterized protein n=1 Tax=Methylocystis parvus TaxID=134 RepID=A0A6B8M4N9_9HYPH|nr:hypothetical protein F7D14_10695 [Methylocystis parvus]